MSSRGATSSRTETALIVFAKAPDAGRVKTRLAALLGEAGAARLHAQMVKRTLRTACGAGFACIELCCSPRVRHPFFLFCEKRFGVRLRAQGSGDIGQRMHRALERGLRRHRYAILIGSDCPALRPSDLRAAARGLRAGADAVFSPAEDGGYALIGLRRVSRRLFAGIDWGGPEALAQTRRRLARLHWRWQELRTVWDVDRPADLARLRRSRLLVTRGTQVSPLPSSRPRPR